MTLFRQLFFGASLLFLLVLAGVDAIYLSNARLYLQQQLESHSQDGATSLSLWLATVKPFDDRALIETVVNTAFDRGYYQSIRVVSVSGETLVDKELPAAQGEVPLWFTRLFPLHPPSAEALISAGWRQLGRVLVTSHPNFAYQQLWHTGTQTLALLLLVYALTLVALRAFLSTLLRPLSAIERAAIAIGERDFRASTLKPKARELGRVVAAINSLSSKIRRVIEDESARAETLQREAYRDAVTGACAGHTAVCSRIGGASFALAALNIDAEAAEVLTALLTSRVEAAIAEQALTMEVEFHCGAAHFDAGAPALAELLAAADLALSRAQQKGSNAFDLIALIELVQGARGSLAWRKEIGDAIDSGKLALYTQTVLSLPAGTPMQSEIFTRILDAVGNAVPAAQFLPMAARHSLMPRLDCRALEMLIARIDAGANLAPMIAVNISAQTVADAASCRRLLDALQCRRDIAARLVFEMTEFGVIQAPALSFDFATEARRLGAQFAIDHFNLHRDSLRQLHQLLPHYIKLAPAYAKELAQNQDSRFIVSSLIRIAQQLEIGVIAQAVESEQLILQLGDVDFAGYQGYASGRPEPVGSSDIVDD